MAAVLEVFDEEIGDVGFVIDDQNVEGSGSRLGAWRLRDTSSAVSLLHRGNRQNGDSLERCVCVSAAGRGYDTARAFTIWQFSRTSIRRLLRRLCLLDPSSACSSSTMTTI